MAADTHTDTDSAPAHGADEGRLIWIDLEMTGLDTDRDSILEIATIVTDAQLNVLAEFDPKVPQSARASRYVFLANASPEAQLKALPPQLLHGQLLSQSQHGLRQQVQQ